jgi:hypothetical protein
VSHRRVTESRFGLVLFFRDGDVCAEKIK